jgi:hypothetical protein
LFVGDVSEPCRGWQRLRAFRDLADVTAIDTSATYKSLADRVRWKIGLPRDVNGTNDVLMRAASDVRPGLIWIEKGNAIWPSTLRALKATFPRALLVAFSEDDMFLTHNRSWYYARGLRYFDLVITTKSVNCHPNELPSLGAAKVVFWNNCYDEELHRPPSTSEIDSRPIDVGFVGTFEQARAESLIFLARNGIRVRVRGNGGWDLLRNASPNLDARNLEITGRAYVQAIWSTKINLCFLRKLNRDQQTARSVEIPACEGFMLAERTREHLHLFEEGSEAEFFETDRELLEKVHYYLSRDSARMEIASHAAMRCKSSGYGIRQALLRLLKEMHVGSLFDPSRATSHRLPSAVGQQ